MSTNDSIRTNRVIRDRINMALINSIEELKEEGLEVPSLSLSIQNENIIRFNRSETFIKVFDTYLNKVDTTYGLSLAEKGIISTLISHISYQDNLLRHSSGMALRRKDLEDVLGLAHNAVDKHLSSLIKKGVLAKVTVKRSNLYYMNPYVAYKGNYIDRTLLNMFKHTQLSPR